MTSPAARRRPDDDDAVERVRRQREYPIIPIRPPSRCPCPSCHHPLLGHVVGLDQIMRCDKCACTW